MMIGFYENENKEPIGKINKFISGKQKHMHTYISDQKLKGKPNQRQRKDKENYNRRNITGKCMAILLKTQRE